MSFRPTLPVVALAAALLAGCGGKERTRTDTSPIAPALRNGKPNVRVVVAPNAPPRVLEAAGELSNALSRITGVEFGEPQPEEGTLEAIQVIVGTGPAEGQATSATALVADAYRITSERSGKRWRVELRGAGPTAVQYAVYELCERFGVRYLHPEETSYPFAGQAWELPLPIDVYRRPDLSFRGHYQETRHPIPAADYLHARHQEDRAALDHHLVWLVRNRLNAHLFHALDNAADPAWPTFVQGHVERAHSLGVEVIPVVSFADDRSRSYRLIGDLDSAAGPQIEASLDHLLQAPFDRVVVRIGSSPLNRPADEVAVAWIDLAVAHLSAAHPGVQLLVWVDARTDIEDGDGGSFFHLATQADPRAGLFVRTSMLFGIEGHQKGLVLAVSAGRPVIYAPDAAFWRGLDIDVPLAIPLVATTRSDDLFDDLDEAILLGQAFASTGQEWGYWLWDLFGARLGWDRTETLSRTLAWMRPVLGKPLEDALAGWASLQRSIVLESDRTLWYYLVGERSEDEAGLLFGEVARPLRPGLYEVLGLKVAPFEAWRAQQTALNALGDGLTALLSALSEPEVPDDDDDTPADRARRELDATLRLTSGRLTLVRAAYDAVVAARDPLEDPDAQKELLEGFRSVATKAVSDAKTRITAGEKRYRHPPLYLFGDREDEEGEPIAPVTAHPRGYLDATHEVVYWERRLDELEALVASPQVPSPKWKKEPALVLRVPAGGVQLAQPDTPEAKLLVEPLLPPILVGVHSWPQGAGEVDVTIAFDRDGDAVPDVGMPQIRIDDGINRQQGGTLFQEQALAIPHLDGLGGSVGELLIAPVNSTLTPKHVGGVIRDVLAGEITGELDVESAVLLISALSGGTLDNAAARAALARSAGVAELGARLDVRITLVGFEEP